MRKAVSIFSVLIVLMSLAFPAYAASDIKISKNRSDITLFSEQKRWVYRQHNGIKQKRLWPVTYGDWLTDWISVK